MIIEIRIYGGLCCDPLKAFLAANRIADYSVVEWAIAMQVMTICCENDYGFHYQDHTLAITGGLCRWDY